MSHRALGRGLEALLGPRSSSETVSVSPDEIAIDQRPKENVLILPLDKIKPNPSQPRRTFLPEKLQELAASIRTQGLVQPIVVVKGDKAGEYILIAGERRWRAAQLAGLSEIPVLVKSAQPNEHLLLSLVENIQREDLNPLEEAAAYQRLVSEFKLSQEEVAAKIGRGRSFVANMIRLLNLPPEVKNFVAEGQISAGHARALLALDDPGQQLKLAEQIISDKLSVRDVERLGQEWKKTHKIRSKSESVVLPDPEVRLWEEKLQKALSTRVRIRHRGKRGWLRIEYFSLAEFERITKFILR